MTQFASVDDTSLATSLFIESADPEDLQDRVNAAIALVDGSTTGIAALTLAGGGDGHTFVVEMVTAPFAALSGSPLAGTTGGVPATIVRCYLAGDDEELAVAKAAAGTPDPFVSGQQTIPYAASDEQLAGASQGTRFMGMTVYGLASIPADLATAAAVMSNDTTQVIAAPGAVLVTFADFTPFPAAFASQFTHPDPAALLYTGLRVVSAEVDASVTVALDAPGTVQADLVTDPLGTPTPITGGRVIITYLSADESNNLSLTALVGLLPSFITGGPTAIGLLLTMPGSGSVESATVRVVQV